MTNIIVYTRILAGAVAVFSMSRIIHMRALDTLEDIFHFLSACVCVKRRGHFPEGCQHFRLPITSFVVPETLEKK